MLGVYFAAAPPLPPLDASAAAVVHTGSAYHASWLLGAWLQATGSLASVVFFVLLIWMAERERCLCGTFTFIGCAVLLAVVAAEALVEIDLAQASVNGHPYTALTDYDLVTAFIHVFPLLPAPLILIGTGAALRRSARFPRSFGRAALCLGGAYLIVAVAGLFKAPALTFVPLGLQSLWVVAVSAYLVKSRPPRVAAALGVAP